MAEAHPDLVGEPLRLLADGWDCVALDLGGRVMIRVPRDGEAARSLETEARLLAALRPRVRMRLPDLGLHRAPRLHSRHEKIPGEHLLAGDYERLGEADRDALAEALAGFFADLHAVPVAAMEASGATRLDPWLGPVEIRRRAWPLLPEGLRPAAEATLDAWAGRGPDPLGEAFGHFDAHGWNMAFDHEAGRINGIYDFGDAGIGPLHQEFVAPTLVSRDLVRRVLPRYERMTARRVDGDRVRHLAGTARLWELAVEAENPATAPLMLAGVAEWFGTA